MPPTTSDATGVAALFFDTNTDNLYVYMHHNVSSPVTITINGPAGNGGTAPVLFTFLDGPQSPISDTWFNIGTTNFDYLKKGLLYIEITSTTFPTGEIRGQIEAPICPILDGALIENIVRTYNAKSWPC